MTGRGDNVVLGNRPIWMSETALFSRSTTAGLVIANANSNRVSAMPAMMVCARSFVGERWGNAVSGLVACVSCKAVTGFPLLHGGYGVHRHYLRLELLGRFRRNSEYPCNF